MGKIEVGESPATTDLIVPWREWRTREDRELNKTTEEVWSEVAGKTYPASMVIMPPSDWEPDPDCPEDTLTQYHVTMCYLTMLADPEFAGQWVSDEL